MTALPECDFNDDGIVNFIDYVIATNNKQKQIGDIDIIGIKYQPDMYYDNGLPNNLTERYLEYFDNIWHNSKDHISPPASLG